MSKYRIFIFDFDGVILNIIKLKHKPFKEYFQDLDLV